MVQHLCIYPYNDNDLRSLIFFNISFFFYKMSLRKCDSFPDYDMICTLYLLTVLFSFLKFNFLHCLLSERFEKLFHAVLSVYMVFVFYTSKCPYHRYCSPTFIVDDFTRLFLHSPIFSNERLKTCLNKRWCLIRV